VPNNCSLGVEYFCIGFPDSIDCRTLPLNISNIIPSSLATIEQLNSIEGLDRALAEVTPRSIKGCLIIGAICAALGIIQGCYLAAHGFELISFPSLGILTLIRFICSLICCIPILALTVILYGPQLKAKELTLERGEASSQVLAALSCATFMIISIVVGWLLDRYNGVLSWRIT
jgi:MFS family permease